MSPNLDPYRFGPRLSEKLDHEKILQGDVRLAVCNIPFMSCSHANSIGRGAGSNRNDSGKSCTDTHSHFPC
jgi:hypothetical protein